MEWRHDPGHVLRAVAPERLAVTKALTAIDPHNSELQAARDAGIPVEPWQQAIADAAAGRYLVGVAGTHGKSTSSGWLVHVLTAAGLDPAAFVGALLPPALTAVAPQAGAVALAVASVPAGADGPAMASTARLGRGRPFVVEADEYAGNFDPYRPNLTVLTSAEWDHPDVFADREAVLECFGEWLRQAAQTVERPVLVANVGDGGVAEIAKRLTDWAGEIVRVQLLGTSHAPGTRAAGRPGAAGQPGARKPGGETLLGRIIRSDPSGTTLELEGSRLDMPLRVHLRLAGLHNAANALGVAGAALTLGVEPDILAQALGFLRGSRSAPGAKGRGQGSGRLRRLRPPPDGDPGNPGRHPAARTRPACLGGL